MAGPFALGGLWQSGCCCGAPPGCNCVGLGTGISMVMTDANTTISLPIDLGDLKWKGGYVIPVTGGASWGFSFGSCLFLGNADGDLQIYYTVECISNHLDVRYGNLVVTRTWGSVKQTFGPTHYYALYQGPPGGPYIGTDGCEGNQSVLIQIPASCSPFAWSGTLTPDVANPTADPVGGTVALS
jgi:hypothetical protein